MIFFINSKQVSQGEFFSSFPDLKEILQNTRGDYELHMKEGQLILKEIDGLELKINARSELEYHKRYFFKNSIHKELLAKAIGLKKGRDKPVVLDCTGGTLKDSLLMYSFGVKLIVCERNPFAAALIHNAIKQNDLDILFHNSSCSDNTYDANVAYFDPMYSHKNEKSLPKKEMRIFRSVVGVDEDDYDTAIFLKKNYKRLVIKRPIKAPALLEGVSMSFLGKSTRYDVYLS